MYPICHRQLCRTLKKSALTSRVRIVTKTLVLGDSMRTMNWWNCAQISTSRIKRNRQCHGRGTSSTWIMYCPRPKTRTSKLNLSNAHKNNRFIRETRYTWRTCRAIGMFAANLSQKKIEKNIICGTLSPWAKGILPRLSYLKARKTQNFTSFISHSCSKMNRWSKAKVY